MCDWVEFLGLPYRKRFLHHLVDGRIAMQLTNNDMKARIPCRGLVTITSDLIKKCDVHAP